MAHKWRVVEKTDGMYYLQQQVGLFWPFRAWVDSSSGPWYNPDEPFLVMEQRMAPRPPAPTIVRELDR